MYSRQHSVHLGTSDLVTNKHIGIARIKNASRLVGALDSRRNFFSPLE